MKHLCGQCESEFKSEKEYLKHTCDKTGYKPTELEHFGEELAKMSQTALERGNKRADLEEQGVDPEEAKKQTADIGSEVR